VVVGPRGGSEDVRADPKPKTRPSMLGSSAKSDWKIVYKRNSLIRLTQTRRKSCERYCAFDDDCVSDCPVGRQQNPNELPAPIWKKQNTKAFRLGMQNLCAGLAGFASTDGRNKYLGVERSLDMQNPVSRNPDIPTVERVVQPGLSRNEFF
jgi:hypothetical protein